MLALFQQLITAALVGAESNTCCTYIPTDWQALILIWVTNKVTMQPSHVVTALPITAP